MGEGQKTFNTEDHMCLLISLHPPLSLILPAENHTYLLFPQLNEKQQCPHRQKWTGSKSASLREFKEIMEANDL